MHRAYIMGPDGHVQSRVDLRCADVAEAVKLAKQLVDSHDVELWQLDRHIDIQAHVRAAIAKALTTADRAR